jgi:hypothetical protein
MSTYVWFVRGAEHAAMCRTSIESIKKADATARCIVMTDEVTHDWLIDGAVVQHFKSGAPLMVANVEAQVQALYYHADCTFLDTDILMLKPLPSAGELTVTWRDHALVSDEGEKIAGIAASMPYNYGVIRAHGLGALEAFIWMRERIRKMYRQQQQWYGNQLALAELAGPRPEAGIAIDSRRIPWLLHAPSTLLTVGKIPCEFYNYTPQAADEDVSARSVLHFKGKKRPLMADFAKRLGLGWYL